MWGVCKAGVEERREKGEKGKARDTRIPGGGTAQSNPSGAS